MKQLDMHALHERAATVCIIVVSMQELPCDDILDIISLGVLGVGMLQQYLAPNGAAVYTTI
jgi:hypothetical protein